MKANEMHQLQPAVSSTKSDNSSSHYLHLHLQLQHRWRLRYPVQVPAQSHQVQHSVASPRYYSTAGCCSERVASTST